MKRSLFILFFFIITVTVTQAQNAADTTGGKWNGIWDPNDPNCPCYKIQKEAEKEYKEMLKGEKRNNEDNKKIESAGLRDEKKNSKRIKIDKKKRKRKKMKPGKTICPEL